MSICAFILVSISAQHNIATSASTMAEQELPSAVTIHDLTGKWTLDKQRSTGFEKSMVSNGAFKQTNQGKDKRPTNIDLTSNIGGFPPLLASPQSNQRSDNHPYRYSR
jgi:hypothetical protein